MPTILVIDDSAIMKRLLRAQLEKHGFEVVEWMPESAFEITDRLTELKPDLVLCDYHMPGVNGLTVAKMVQKTTPPIPMIILTALRDGDVQANLEKFGVKLVLNKPIDADSLVAVIREVLT